MNNIHVYAYSPVMSDGHLHRLQCRGKKTDEVEEDKKFNSV
jgi:hypothetical protein